MGVIKLSKLWVGGQQQSTQHTKAMPVLHEEDDHEQMPNQEEPSLYPNASNQKTQCTKKLGDSDLEKNLTMGVIKLSKLWVGGQQQSTQHTKAMPVLHEEDDHEQMPNQEEPSLYPNASNQKTQCTKKLGDSGP
eukprot:CAMPEP_0184673728 /NCGR_PEP_ID=MMETSP0308-20130426/86839_1 /TAXON_ID=38269 /ORGANISM="Gloeochaete witrockiana, Strain SAG 46.84" /LENGTH=133 /DNA_ID=CAMNT_0027121247 /DNA_START=1018 /DNA_END=1420 /DNA_ORIENTATION=+